ncbi:oligosaccharide flippase family protein [Moraxella osloensis]|nr:oligosaccharide flippase family protein [Moraxella osloensis]MBW4017396.1 oligosaccharide flippase family protein [Moraxella osloensis]
MHKQIVSNIFWLIAEKIITIILVFYVEGVIARLLSQQDYGKWIYSVNLVLLLSSLSLIVGAEVLVPTLSKHKKLTESLLLNTFFIRLIFGFFAFVCTTLYANFFVTDVILKSFLSALALVLLLNEPFGVVTSYFQSKVNILPVTIVRIIALGVRALVATVILKWALSIDYIPWSRVLESVTSAIGLSLLYIIYRGKIRFNFSKKISKILFYRGLLLWPSLMMMYFFQRIDRFFIEHYLSFNYLALYGISVQIIEQATLLFGMVVQSIAPIFIFNRMSDAERFGKLNRIVMLMVGLSMVSIIVGYFLVPLFIHLVYGKSYDGAIPITIGLLPSLLFFSIDTVLTQYFYAKNLGNKLIYKWIVMAIVTCINYWVCLGVFQLESAVLVFNINYLIMLLITVFLFKKYIYKEVKISIF